MGGLDGCELLRASLRVAPNVCYFLPRNVDRRQATGLAAADMLTRSVLHNGSIFLTPLFSAVEMRDFLEQSSDDKE